MVGCTDGRCKGQGGEYGPGLEKRCYYDRCMEGFLSPSLAKSFSFNFTFFSPCPSPSGALYGFNHAVISNPLSFLSL